MKTKTIILLFVLALVAGTIYYLESQKVQPITNLEITGQQNQQVQLKDLNEKMSRLYQILQISVYFFSSLYGNKKALLKVGLEV